MLLGVLSCCSQLWVSSLCSWQPCNLYCVLSCSSFKWIKHQKEFVCPCWWQVLYFFHSDLVPSILLPSIEHMEIIATFWTLFFSAFSHLGMKSGYWYLIFSAPQFRPLICALSSHSHTCHFCSLPRSCVKVSYTPITLSLLSSYFTKLHTDLD